MANSITWTRIAEDINELEFAANNIAIADLNGKKICIGRFNESVFAFPYNCPHASGLLAEGYIDALGNIVCPVHHYKYNLQTGRNVSGEGYWLKTWPVEIRADGVYLKIESSDLFGNLRDV